MKFHGISLQEGSNIDNLTVASGTSFPTSPDEGEMFFRSDASLTVKGLYLYVGGSWDRVASTESLSAPTGTNLPGSANPGDLFYRDSNDSNEGLYAYNGSSWVSISTGISAPLNQILYGTGSTVSSESDFTWNPDTNVMTLASPSTIVGGGTTGGTLTVQGPPHSSGGGGGNLILLGGSSTGGSGGNTTITGGAAGAGAGGDANISGGTGTGGNPGGNVSISGGAGGSSGTIRINTAGTERIRVDASGNVGIGTSSPSSYQKLTVWAGNIHIQSTTAAPGVGAQLILSDVNNFSFVRSVTIGANSELALGTNGTEKVRVSSDGSVSIGTTIGMPTGANTARRYLTLSSSDAGSIGALSFWPQSANQGNNGNIEWYDSGNTSSASLRNAFIFSGSVGGTANNRGSFMAFATKLDNESSGGVERMRIDQAGNVGIGNATPAFRLQVSGSGSSGIVAATSTDGSGGTTYIQANSNVDGRIGTFSALPLLFVTANTERARIGAAGNVIINTPGSGDALTVNGGDFSTATVKVVSAATQAKIALWCSDPSANTRNWDINASHTAYGDLVFRRSNAIGGNPSTAGTSVLSMSYLGNIAIGAVPTAARLHLSSSGSATGTVTNISQLTGSFNIAGSVADQCDDGISFSSGGGGGAAITLGRDSGFGTLLKFYTNNTASAGTTTERMRIDPNGNVGIGTTSPTYKFVVSNGGASGLEFNIGGTNQIISYNRSSPQYVPISLDGASLTVTCSAVNALVIDANRNLGVSVAPSAWHSGQKSIDIATNAFIRGDSASCEVGNNVYYDGSNFRYKGSLPASSTTYNSGHVIFNTVAAGTAGTVASFTEKARLDVNGNFLLGTQTPIGSGSNTVASYTFAKTYGWFAITDAGGIYIQRSQGTDGGVLSFYRGSSNPGNVTVTATATTYATSSDARLKKNVVDAPSAGSKIDSIQIRSFDWKINDAHTEHGTIAQELAIVAPEAVQIGDASEEIAQTWGVDYSALVPLLVKEIQELRARVLALESAT